MMLTIKRLALTTLPFLFGAAMGQNPGTICATIFNPNGLPRWDCMNECSNRCNIYQWDDNGYHYEGCACHGVSYGCCDLQFGVGDGGGTDKSTVGDCNTPTCGYGQCMVVIAGEDPDWYYAANCE
jgi:hypothetical protein